MNQVTRHPLNYIALIVLRISGHNLSRGLLQTGLSQDHFWWKHENNLSLSIWDEYINKDVFSLVSIGIFYATAMKSLKEIFVILFWLRINVSQLFNRKPISLKCKVLKQKKHLIIIILQRNTSTMVRKHVKRQFHSFSILPWRTS